MDLIEKLVGSAEHWARANERSLARLATIVVNDGKLFERIASGGSCTVATYEKIMGHLRDPANWAEGIPSEAAHLLDIVVAADNHDPADTGRADSSSFGKADKISGRVSA